MTTSSVSTTALTIQGKLGFVVEAQELYIHVT